MKAVFAFALIAAVSVAFADSSSASPTAWHWRTGSASSINDQIDKGNRVVNVELYSSSPFLLTALFVRNTGVYKKESWFYDNIDAAELKSKIAFHKARIADLEPYVINGKLLFTVVLVPNTGSDAKIFWYYHGVSSTYISEKIKENKARLVDIDTYQDGSVTRYAAVMIRNSGSDGRTWWWYPNLSLSVVSSKIAQNKARLMNIERNSAGKYTVIMERSAGRWSWYPGLTSSELLAKTKQNGARLFKVLPYIEGGKRKWIGIMIGNLNELSEKVYNYMQNKRTGGSFGFYMRQVNGPVHAALMEDHIFEPASTIKALHHAHAMRRVSLGTDKLTNPTFIFTDMKNSCPLSSGGPKASTLEAALKDMMRYSSNPATQALRVRYGEAAINLSAKQMGMTKTRIAHRIGCASGPPGIIGQLQKPNWLTLVDISNLYSRVATTWLTSSARAKFFEIMISHKPILALVDQEGQKLPGLSATKLNEFRSKLLAKQKSGVYLINGKKSRSTAGYARLPFKSCNGGTFYKHYTFGAFVDKAPLITEAASANACTEMMRPEIKKALLSFSQC